MSSQRRQPYKSMPVVYRAIGGSEYAAIVTDVRPEGVTLTTFLPGGALQSLTRVPFKWSGTELKCSAEGPCCFFVSPQDGFEP